MADFPLPRYDWNTLQTDSSSFAYERGEFVEGMAFVQPPTSWIVFARSRSDRPNSSTCLQDSYVMPRLYPSWSLAPPPLAVDPMAPRPVTPLGVDPHGTVRTLKSPYIRPLVVDGTLNGHPMAQFNAGNEAVVATSPVAFNWEERLFENYHVGVHRVIFLLRRFPALAAFVASIWIFFGRHEAAGFELGTQEKNQNLTVFITTLASLIGLVLGVRNHGNKRESAVFQIVYRLTSLFTSLAGEITAFVFGLIAVLHLNKLTEPVLPDCYPQSCFSLNDKIVQSGVQLGLTFLSAVLTVVSIFHGIRAIVRIYYDRNLEKRFARRTRELASYSNPMVTQPDAFF